MKEYVLDGEEMTSLEAFAEQFSRVLRLETNWRGSLDAFNDILRGGFGTPEEGFVIRWINSDTSRTHLGYAETTRQLERRLERCHSSNRTAVSRELRDAMERRGATVFDRLVEIIARHGPGGQEAEDNVRLILQ
jgi:RNAse (barnase) inhibitor barstar